MITEDYCSYEVAKLLKEKGFDEPCLQMWECGPDKRYLFRLQSSCYQNITEEDSCLAPTLQMAMKWLREIYKLSIEPYSIAIEENCIGYAYAICSCKTGLEIFAERWDGKNPFVSYEEAVEAALKYSLENLI